MATTLEWEHVGPARESTIEVPGLSIGNYAYVLVHDPVRDRIVYVRAVDFGGDADRWTWDGAAWERHATPTKASETHAFFDTARAGIAIWNVAYDHALTRHVPRGTILDGKAIATTGEPPVIEPEGDEELSPSSNFACAMAYDAAREVTVCLTRRGVRRAQASVQDEDEDEGAEGFVSATTAAGSRCRPAADRASTRTGRCSGCPSAGW
ncbi:MAG: hypothetical protein KIT31_23565 [Deltaproteobacteria bacterium]|nr:hypothetical protein [Deltaproteobacteria bacterium]